MLANAKERVFCSGDASFAYRPSANSSGSPEELFREIMAKTKAREE